MVIGYVRVSTDEQHLSVDAQREELERWCRAQRQTLSAVYEDVGVSGSAPIDKRPGLLAALNALRKGDILLVVRRDRLARSILAAALSEHIAAKAGATIRTVKDGCEEDTPETALMRTILDAFAQYERALIAMRTKAALQQKRAKGEKTGGAVPYGFKAVGRSVRRLERDEAEQAIIARAKALQAEGLSLRAIGRKLAEEGRRPRSGGAWHPETISNILAGN
jgi:DNA invertase Pin-like site-specific DNA recombinase